MPVQLPVLMLGAGGHATVLLDALLQQGRSIKGILDPDQNLWGSSLMDVPVLGDDETILSFSPESIELVNGLGSVRSTKARQKLYETWTGKGYRFASVIHPRAVISPFARLEPAVQVLAGVVINAHAQLGSNCIINSGAIIEHDCVIGEHVHIAPGVVLAGNVRVGQGSHVGLSACVLQNLSLGTHCLVAAGAVVIHSVTAGETVMGIPAQVRR